SLETTSIFYQILISLSRTFFKVFFIQVSNLIAIVLSQTTAILV
ncbi:hypothetical protein HMPREF0819_1420, partial [Streptococcus equinus ATCC 9812]